MSLKTPKAWTYAWRENKITTAEVAAVSLTDKYKKPGQSFPGWCVYASTLRQSPEIEILCGGINDKECDAAAIFRQGNLLHFGFQPDPSKLNAFGRGLLLNSIVYIARFTEDRPIAETPSIWSGDTIPPSRSSLKRYQHATIPKDPSAREIWLKENRGKLAPDKNNKLVPDADLQKLGVDNDDTLRFFSVAIGALSGELDLEARRVLNRYAPSGPGARGSKAAWQAFWQENGPYLFFSDSSGYRWYLDPLAKSRGVPTAELRGSARATLKGNPTKYERKTKK